MQGLAGSDTRVMADACARFVSSISYAAESFCGLDAGMSSAKIYKIKDHGTQLKAGTFRKEWISLTYGDDPIDQLNISRGIVLFNELHLGQGNVMWGCDNE